MAMWWRLLGGTGAFAALALFGAQLVTAWRAGTTQSPACVYGERVAVRWVGAPLAVLSAALFLGVAAIGGPPGWWVGAVGTVAMMPLRRVLNLNAFAKILRRVDYDQGPVVDRDGTPVAGQPVRRLVATWYRHEFSGWEPLEAVLVKLVAVVAHLALWPLTLLAAQASHVRMCQEPWDALGHETDSTRAPGEGLRDLGQPVLRSG